MLLSMGRSDVPPEPNDTSEINTYISPDRPPIVYIIYAAITTDLIIVIRSTYQAGRQGI